MIPGLEKNFLKHINARMMPLSAECPEVTRLIGRLRDAADRRARNKEADADMQFPEPPEVIPETLRIAFHSDKRKKRPVD